MLKISELKKAKSVSYQLEINSSKISTNVADINFKNLTVYGFSLLSTKTQLDHNTYFTSVNEVKGEYRYLLKYDTSTSSFNLVFNSSGSNPLNLNVIYLILESPHKNEYDVPLKPIGNCRGHTGKNIEKYIIDVVNNAGIKNQNHIIYIRNAVPLQCSLGSLFKGSWLAKTRDLIWDELFLNQGYDTKLIKDIQNVNPSVILNCSTGGPQHKKGTIHKNRINAKVYNVLSSTFVNVYNCYHPSKWSQKPQKKSGMRNYLGVY